MLAGAVGGPGEQGPPFEQNTTPNPVMGTDLRPIQGSRSPLGIAPATGQAPQAGATSQVPPEYPAPPTDMQSAEQRAGTVSEMNTPGANGASQQGVTDAMAGANPLAQPQTQGGEQAGITGQYGKWANALAFGQQALNLGTSIWNATRQPNELPQPEQVSLDRVNYQTGALEADLAQNRTRSTANALGAARGAGLNANELTGVYANNMAQGSADAATVENIANQERNINAQIQHQENSANTASNNNFAMANAEMLNNFDAQRGMHITQGVSNIAGIERDRMNTQLSLNSIYQAGNMSDLNNEYDLMAMKQDPSLIRNGVPMTRNEYIMMKQNKMLGSRVR
jgi:hypothetical protein